MYIIHKIRDIAQLWKGGQRDSCWWQILEAPSASSLASASWHCGIPCSLYCQSSRPFPRGFDARMFDWLNVCPHQNIKWYIRFDCENTNMFFKISGTPYFNASQQKQSFLKLCDKRQSLHYGGWHKPWRKPEIKKKCTFLAIRIFQIEIFEISFTFVSSEGALYVILPYDYQPTFWTHTGP